MGTKSRRRADDAHKLYRVMRNDNLKRIFISSAAMLVVQPLIVFGIYWVKLLAVSFLGVCLAVLSAEIFQLIFLGYCFAGLRPKRKRSARTGGKDRPMLFTVIYWTGTEIFCCILGCVAEDVFIGMVVCLLIMLVITFAAIGSKRKLVVYGVASLGILIIMNLFHPEMTYRDDTLLLIAAFLGGVVYMYRYEYYIQRVTETERLENVTIQAETDPLTKLLNRRGMNRRLSQVWEICKREERHVAVIMVDIDNFKKFDTFGHLSGDECISKIAQQISLCTRRQSDFAVRFGGEEFLIFLNGADEQQALTWAKDLKACVEDMRIPHTSSNFLPFVTISIGICGMALNEDVEFFELQAKADEALYMAKDSGRACICLNEGIYQQTKPVAQPAENHYQQKGFRAL